MTVMGEVGAEGWKDWGGLGGVVRVGLGLGGWIGWWFVVCACNMWASWARETNEVDRCEEV